VNGDRSISGWGSSSNAPIWPTTSQIANTPQEIATASLGSTAAMSTTKPPMTSGPGTCTSAAPTSTATWCGRSP
jgi:hypothetical protein